MIGARADRPINFNEKIRGNPRTLPEARALYRKKSDETWPERSLSVFASRETDLVYSRRGRARAHRLDVALMVGRLQRKGAMDDHAPDYRLRRQLYFRSPGPRDPPVANDEQSPGGVA